MVNKGNRMIQWHNTPEIWLDLNYLHLEILTWLSAENQQPNFINQGIRAMCTFPHNTLCMQPACTSIWTGCESNDFDHMIKKTFRHHNNDVNSWLLLHFYSQLNNHTISPTSGSHSRISTSSARPTNPLLLLSRISWNATSCRVPPQQCTHTRRSIYSHLQLFLEKEWREKEWNTWADTSSIHTMTWGAIRTQ